MEKIKRETKGYILSIEAFLSLLVVIALMSSLPILLGKEETQFDSFVLLSDSFEVLEKGYHDSFATWIDFGIIDPGFSQYFEFIQNETGKKVSVSYSSRNFPDYNCTPEISMKRLVVTNTGPHNTITIFLCK